MFVNMTFLNVSKSWAFQMCDMKVQIVKYLQFCIISMVEHKWFNYLYLGKLGKLANPTLKLQKT